MIAPSRLPVALEKSHLRLVTGQYHKGHQWFGCIVYLRSGTAGPASGWLLAVVVDLNVWPVSLHHVEARAQSCSCALCSFGNVEFGDIYRMVLAVSGASSSTAPYAASSPDNREDRGRGNHSGVTSGLVE